MKNRQVMRNRALTVGILLWGTTGIALAQNCPADLEWPSTTQLAPATTNKTAVVAWPPSLETTFVITDRHPKARLSIAATSSAPPQVDTTVCDPNFQTATTRLTPSGYSLFAYEAFSAGGTWVLALGGGGSTMAFALNPDTGKPVIVNGSVRQIPISFEMLPQAPDGSICSLSSSFWSPKTDGIVYLVGCGTRVFKYNLALYNPANPRAGLVAGSGPRAIATWPNCPQPCRQGPVFMDFSDLFAQHSQDGRIGTMNVIASEDELTFSGTLTRYDGYKNARGMFVYRPGNNSLWYAVSPLTTPETPFFLSASFQGVAVNKRMLGGSADRLGRYFSIGVCGDPTYSLGGCGTATTYILDLDATPQGATLASTIPTGVDAISHGAASQAMRIGANGVTQSLAVQYFAGAPEKKLLTLPNLGNNNGGWWGSYTSAARTKGPSGSPFAALFSTYSYDTFAGAVSIHSGCPSRHCLYANELILFNTSGTRFVRVGQTQSWIKNYAIEAYWDLPHVGISPNGKLVAFVSNWGTQSTATQANQAIYILRLPVAWQMLLDDKVTVNPESPSLPVGAWSDLIVSHLPSASGMNVLLQDGAQRDAIKSTACQIQVTKNKTMQLASDTGAFTDRFSGPLGSPSAGILENSRCKFDLANSAVDATTHGNIIYRLRVQYKTPFQGKSIRAIAQTIGATTWTDGARFSVLPSTTLSWTRNSAPRPESGSSEVEAAVGTQWQYSTDPLSAGSSFEFPIEDPQGFQVSLASEPPNDNTGAPSDSHVTVRVATSADGTPQLEVLQDSGSRQLAVSREVTPGAIVKLEYRMNGTIAVFLDGRELAVGYAPGGGGGLYLVTDRVNPQARIVASQQ